MAVQYLIPEDELVSHPDLDVWKLVQDLNATGTGWFVDQVSLRKGNLLRSTTTVRHHVCRHVSGRSYRHVFEAKDVESVCAFLKGALEVLNNAA